MSELAIPLMIASTAVSAYGAYKQGQMQQGQAEAQAEQARAQAAYQRMNANMALEEAKAEQEASVAELKQHRRGSQQKMATLRARMGASGVAPTGSPLLLEEDTASELALEHAWLRVTGARKVKRWRGQSLLDMKQAEMSMTSASNLQSAGRDYAKAGKWSAGASLLGGGAKTAYMMGSGGGGQTWNQAKAAMNNPNYYG